MTTFEKYFFDQSPDDLNALSPTDREAQSESAKVKLPIVKKVVEHAVAGLDELVQDRLNKIDKQRVRLCRGETEAILRIVDLRAEIENLKERKPYLDRELKELFAE